MMRQLIRIIIVLLVGQMACIPDINASSDIEWPMFRHDPQHTGYSISLTPNILNLCWISNRVFYSGASLSSSRVPNTYAISNGKIYIGTWDGMACLNESNGFKLWSFSTGEAKTIDQLDYVLSTPCLYMDKVFFVSRKGFVFCLNAKTGEEIWSISPLRSDWIFIESSPIIKNGRIFFGVVQFRGGSVYCLNADTGDELWNFTHFGPVVSSPIIVNGKVFVGSYDLLGHCLETMVALDEETGEIIWSSKGGGFSSPAYSQGYIIVGSLMSNCIYCLDSSTGNVLWEYKTNNKVVSSPAIHNDLVVIGSDDMNVYCLNVHNGELKWKYFVGSPIKSSPAIADGKVFFGAGQIINQSYWESKLYVLNETTGKLLWLGNTLRASIAGWNIESESCSPIIANGKVFISSVDEKLYCFGPMIFNLTIKPVFFDIKDNPLYLQPELWSILYGNGTIITTSKEVIINGPMGPYSITSVIWKGYQVIPRLAQAEFFDNPYSKRISYTFTTSNQVWYPKINCILPTELTLSLNPTIKINSNIRIQGCLTCNKIGVSNSDILLLYSVTDGVTWNEITQVKTQTDGDYSAVWIPSATSNYKVKAIWRGNESYPGSDISSNLAVIPYDDDYILPVSSNSTISSLIWDSHDRELHFNVEGPSNTTGYAQVAIAKVLISNKNGIKVYLDGNEMPYQLKSTNDSWVLLFTYKHSMHKVVITLGSTPLGWRIPEFFSESIFLVLILGIIIIWFLKKRMRL